MKTPIAIFAFAVASISLAATTTFEERVETLEYLTSSVPGCDNEAEFNNPTYQTPPEYAIQRYGLTREEFLQDLVALSQRYPLSDTNEQHRASRITAIEWMRTYGTTNVLGYLETIWSETNDYARCSALESAICLSVKADAFFDICRYALSPTNSLPSDFSSRVYVLISDFCTPSYVDAYLNDPAQEARIASFILECADLDRTASALFLDRVACRLNPSYRHSQRRKANLDGLHSLAVGLGGKSLDLYNARVLDAQSSGE